MRDYDPNDWYWQVNGNTVKVFSSAIGDYVPTDDPRFVAWLDDENRPTVIDTEINLGDVLAKAGVRPVNVDVLDAYQASQAATIVSSPAFKPTFYLLKQLAALQGSPVPTVADAVAFTKSML